MSILISAPIRTGKTLFAIKKIFEELNKGKMVYTNIVGIKIDGVISVSSGIGEPFDWRDLPNGSVLVWDEAHEHPAFSNQDLLKDIKINETTFDLRKKQIADSNKTLTDKKLAYAEIERDIKNAKATRKEEILDIGRGMLLHGHFGIEIYLITQRVEKLNADVIGSVVTHYVMRRKFGMDASTIWEFGEAMTSWSKVVADTALNKRLWRYPKHLYKFYVSSENHNVKKTFPLKYLAFLLIPILLFGSALKDSFQTGFFGLFPKKNTTENSVKNTTENSSPGLSPEMKELKKNIDDCVFSGHDVEFCRTKYDKNYQSPSLDCRKAENLDFPQCKNFYKDMTSNNASFTTSSQGQINIIYDASKPFDDSQIRSNLVYEVKQKPVFSGCMKKGSKYIAYTQQGTILHDVSQSDCSRLIDDSDRPFDYFKDTSPVATITDNQKEFVVDNYQERRQVINERDNPHLYLQPDQKLVTSSYQNTIKD